MTTQNIHQAQSEIKKNIIDLFEIDKLPLEQQEEAINNISTTIFKAVLMRVLPTLKEADLAEYEKLIDANVSPDGLMEFFFDKVPDFLQIIAEESANFREESEKILNSIQ
jgi:hypothetical protein